jgi:glutaconate CoA-transferase subunit B
MFAKDYSNKELMAAVCANEIVDNECVFVGIGIPMMAALVATRTHARNTVLFYEAGGIGAISRRLPFTISDNPCTENALIIPEMWRVFADTQCGYVDTGLIGGAQVDKFGNLNTTVITRGGEKSYAGPAVRLPGSGGGNDIASSCRKTIIVMSLSKDKFVRKVDYITSPGYLSGPGAREAAGLLGGGPAAVITDKCLMRFDPRTREMFLDALYPGVSVEDIKNSVQWDLKVSSKVKNLEPPLEEQVRLMRSMDPAGIILGKKSVDKEENFETWYREMKAAYESVTLEL